MFASQLQRQQSLPAAAPTTKIVLADTRQEAVEYDRLGDLFSLLVTLERLETAYVRDLAETNAYNTACVRLLAQIRTWMGSHGALIPSLDDFSAKYTLNCPAALARIRAGVPAALLHGDAEAETRKNRALNVLDIGERFITAMDALKLNMKAVDELYPTVNEILETLNRFPSLPAEHDARVRVRKWVALLAARGASDELDDAQSRQMFFDLEQAYTAFRKFLTATSAGAGAGGGM